VVHFLGYTSSQLISVCNSEIIIKISVFSTSAHQLLTDVGRRISQMSGELSSLATSFRDVRCWYSASTPSCYTTVCWPLIARTNDTTIIVSYSILLKLSGIYLVRVKIIIYF